MTSLRVLGWFVTLGVLSASVACGGDDDSGSGSDEPDAPFATTGGFGGFGGSGGSGASPFTGGAPTVTGGAGGSGGSVIDSGTPPPPDAGDAAAVDGADAGCVYTGTPVDPTVFPECTLCQNARCVPTSLVPPETVDQLADCDAMSKCVPNSFIATAGQFVLDACRSVDNAEGRCVPLCVPLVADQQSFLPQGTCADDERCAPCYDPRTGTETGACSVSCDVGPTEPAYTFEHCCGDLGLCVPAELVPVGQRSSLGADTCSDTTRLCAPNSLASGTPPVTCRSLANAEGRCVPACLPAVAPQASRLPTDGCGTGEVCAPCYDPLSGDATGACTINGDMPTEPPVTFANCCNDLGACVPSTVVPADQVSFLGTDSCTGAGELCAPRDLADPTFIPLSCTSLNNAEGRCLPDCLPDVAAQAGFLPQDVCAPNHLCAPCYNPLGGDPTGACTLNGDAPTQPPSTFSVCCSDIGSCMPTTLLPDAASALLGVDNCSASTELCVPHVLSQPGWIPDTCDAIGGFEGRCLPVCLNFVTARPSQVSQSTCDPSFLCTPCYDPITGTETYACRVNGDAPVEPPQTFEKCCGGLGSCVPPSVVSAEQLPLLGPDTCTSATAVCAPDQLADSSFIPPSCTSLAGGEGRCLPACLPDIAAQASVLPQDTCAAGHLCAPCYDPRDGAATSACTLNGDAPTQPPTLFPSCCGGLGTCLPPALVPADQLGFLGTDTCTGAGELCSPKALADETVTPPICSTIGGFEGRCLPACLPSVAAQAGTLPQDSCAAGHLCAPCYEPLTSADTGLCHFNGDAPTQPPGVFGRCCNNTGSCLPPSLIPADQQALLNRGTCSDATTLCLPDVLAGSSVIPPTCTSIAGAEGRCLPSCLPSVAAQASYLPQDTCASDELCAPCYDPVDGANTGACDINSDAPTQPPTLFPGCCSGNGICVPDSTLGTNEAAWLPQLTCPDSTWSCASVVKVQDPSASLPSCQASAVFFGFPLSLGPGACMDTCFVPPDLAAVLRQNGCASGQLCVPCTEPAAPLGNGLSTGACD